VDGSPNIRSSGLSSAEAGRDVTFEAQLDWTAYAGQPITYTWSVSGYAPLVHPGRGVTDTVTLQWATSGIKELRVSATGPEHLASATRSISVTPFYYRLYAPLVRR
jgi:hypothetical protein